MDIMNLREVMKAHTALDEEIISDKKQELPQPAMDKAYISAKSISLPKDFEDVVRNNSFLDIISQRTSRRVYNDMPLTLEELSFLLWTTQGVKTIIGKKNKATLRMVPSAGARHPFETYLFVNNVEGLESGRYHYVATEHRLEYLGVLENQMDRVSEACCGQTFVGTCAVTFIWTAIPYRSEWRYTNKAQKYCLIDLGHVGQNLYLACEAIGCGTCGIGAYDQALADALLGLDTEPSNDKENEFVVYMGSVGKYDAKEQ